MERKLRRLLLRGLAVLVAASLIGPSIAAASMGNHAGSHVSTRGNIYYVTLPGYFHEKIFQEPYLKVYDTFVLTVTEPCGALHISIDYQYCIETVYLIVVLHKPRRFFVSGYPYCHLEWRRDKFYGTGTYIIYVSLYDTRAPPGPYGYWVYMTASSLPP